MYDGFNLKKLMYCFMAPINDGQYEVIKGFRGLDKIHSIILLKYLMIFKFKFLIEHFLKNQKYIEIKSSMKSRWFNLLNTKPH